MVPGASSPNWQGRSSLLLLLLDAETSISGGVLPGMPSNRRANPRQFDEYLKAYSVAMLPGRPRDNVSYGGKSAWPTAIHRGDGY